MKTKHDSILSRSLDSEISSVTCEGWGKPIVFHLTPLGMKRHKLLTRRWNAEQVRIEKENERYARNSSRRLALAVKKMKKEYAALLHSLKTGKIPVGHKHKCTACGKIEPCRRYKDRWFCVKCLKMNRKKEIEVICPRHKTWCGGKYGSCGGCLGESLAYGLPY